MLSFKQFLSEAPNFAGTRGYQKAVQNLEKKELTNQRRQEADVEYQRQIENWKMEYDSWRQEQNKENEDARKGGYAPTQYPPPQKPERPPSKLIDNPKYALPGLSTSLTPSSSFGSSQQTTSSTSSLSSGTSPANMPTRADKILDLKMGAEKYGVGPEVDYLQGDQRLFSPSTITNKLQRVQPSPSLSIGSGLGKYSSTLRF